MSIQKQLRKTMIDEGVKDAKALHKLSGVSYKRTLAVLNDKPEAYLNDAGTLGLALGIKLSYIDIGDK